MANVNFPRVTTRPFELEDIDEILGWYKHAKISQNLFDGLESEESLRLKFKELASGPVSGGETFGIVVEAKGSICAFIHVMWVNWISRTAEVDFVRNPNTEAPFLIVACLRALTWAIFETLNIRKIYSYIYHSNKLSMRLFSEIMVEELVLHRYLCRDGQWEDVSIFSIQSHAVSRFRIKELAKGLA